MTAANQDFFILFVLQFMVVIWRSSLTEAKYQNSLSLPHLASYALHQFTFNLSKNLNEENNNFAFAPISIFGTLTALEPALRGRSRRQTRNVLGLARMKGGGVKQVTGMLRTIYNPPTDDGDSYSIFRAQRLYADKSLIVTQSYTRFVQSTPSLDLRKIDFFAQPLSSLRRINRFVSRMTRGGVANLLSEDMITSNTKLFLAEAFILETSWMVAFDPRDTRSESFKLDADRTINVPTMKSNKQRCHIGQLSNDFPDTALLIIPFKNAKLTMTIVMPGTEGNFAPLEEAGAARIIHQSLNRLPREENGSIIFQDCAISLPKFEISSTVDDLTPVLKKLGIVDLFARETADLSGLVDNYHMGSLCIEHAVHQTKVSVSEVGLKSAAATGMGGGLRSFNQAIVNRPFVFMVRHEATGAVLLYGKVLNPSI